MIIPLFSSCRPRMLFCWIVVIQLVVLMLLAGEIYDAGPVVAGLVALWLWASMQVWAVLFEGRTMLSPKENFWQYLFGDLALTALIVYIAVRSDGVGDGHFWQTSTWTLVAVVASLAAIVLFRINEKGAWHRLALGSATKLNHDILLIGGYLFLIVKQGPVLLTEANSWVAVRPVAAVNPALVLIVIWAALFFIDARRVKQGKLDFAHVRQMWTAAVEAGPGLIRKPKKSKTDKDKPAGSTRRLVPLGDRQSAA